MTKDGDGEVVAGGAVADEHVEWSGGGALFDEAVNADSFWVGVVGEDGAEGFGIAVEGGDDGFVLCEVIFEIGTT